jgi:uncharacterized protein YecE (DUF72 family)
MPDADLIGLHPRLHIGTSSFSDDSWIGPFYPVGTKPADMLPYYATRYTTVEVDSTYYRPPSPTLCRRWHDVTPADFRFSLKVPSEITHKKALVGVEKDWDSFLEAVRLLGPKLAYLVLQFPYWNLKSPIPNVKEFITRLDAFTAKASSPCPLVVETRNPKWIGKELLDFLKGRNLILALQDQQWMPRPKPLFEKWGDALRTGPGVYIRMLGEREVIEKITETWEKIVIDRSEQTAEWLPIVRHFLAQEQEVNMYFNNHFEGHAPASIEKLKALWKTGFTQPPQPG